MNVKQKKIEMKITEQNKGITLIALVITIIVLLILAGVTIATLTGDNGLLQKAQTAKETNEESEIYEKIKLVYAEYQIAENSNKELDENDFLTKSLQNVFGENAKATLSNGKLKATINGKMYRYNVSTGKTEGYTDPFNYGTKTKDTLAQGNDITIGTEKFMVFSVTETEIKAMPYYNLKLDANPIKQATAETAEEAGTSVFSSIDYWESPNTNVNMDDSRNSIQPYIIKYKETLEDLGVEDVEVRAPKATEIKESAGGEILNNPSQIGPYWIGTVRPEGKSCLWYVSSNGRKTYDNKKAYSGTAGVRPIIIIKK